MRSIIGTAFFVAISFTFPAGTLQTLQDRYGHPISETYRVRPGVAAVVQFGASGQVCAIVVEPEKPDYPLTNPKNKIGDYRQTGEILRELVPEAERGKFVLGGFVDMACGEAEGDCGGTEDNWEKLTMFRSGSNDRQHYATIRWKREECKAIEWYRPVYMSME